MDLVTKIALVGLLGVGAQWLAWRLKSPSIVLMAIAGILAGPVFGLLDPETDFGDVLKPVISLAVAIILFEGGLTLKFKELREVGQGVIRLVVVGAPVGWVLGALAAHYVGGLDWPVAILFGGLLVVTGPTVIIPLLRQAKLAPKVGNTLKWEGIVNDPVGALLAVMVFEYLRVRDQGGTVLETAGWFAVAIVLAAILGLVLGRFAVWLFTSGHAPGYLKNPLLLGLVLVGFVLANMLEHEMGLVTVTVMGVTIANSRVAELERLHDFKEQITVLLVSGVFVLITATITPEIVNQIGWRELLFVLAVLFVVRPLTILIATLGTKLTWKERALVGWVAPRGIVAVAVAGIFGPGLVEEGYDDAEKLVPLTFAIVFATVTAHGFTLKPLARRLGLVSTERPGVLLVGGGEFAARLGQALQDLKVPVMVTDRIYHRLRPARKAGLRTYYGEILSEDSEHHVDFNRYDYLLSVSDSDEYNALVAAELGRNFERENVFQLPSSDEENDERRSLSYRVKGNVLFGPEHRIGAIEERLGQGWGFRKTKLTEKYGFDEWLDDKHPDAVMVSVLDEDGTMQFNTPEERPEPEVGQTILALVPPTELGKAQRQHEEAALHKDGERLPG